MSVNKKRGAPPRYEESFKIGAIKLITENGRSPREVADELGVHIDTIKNWLKSSGYSTQIYKEKADNKKLRELEAENRSLKKQLEKKTRGYRNPKKVYPHNFRHIKEKYEYIKNSYESLFYCEIMQITQNLSKWLLCLVKS